MSHHNAYDSFRTKKSIEKKSRAKERAFGKRVDLDDDFVVEDSKSFGVVIETKYNEAHVFYDDEIVVAGLKRNMKGNMNQIVFPGDKVVIDSAMGKSVIQNLISRTSELTRIKKDSTRLNNNGKIEKVIAANIDVGVNVVSAQEPPLHPKFIDRYLMILQNSNIQPVICLNKCDLKTEKEELILDVYRRLGIPVVETSAHQNIGIEKLAEYLRGKQAIFVGNSGVGKSSLTNALMDSDEIKTSHVSEKSKRGRHTTTASKYYVWDKDSSIIDTPGIRSLDVSSFSPMEVKDYFPEFDGFSDKCKYNNCLHFNEPTSVCAVKRGVDDKLINADRYKSYVRIMEDVMGEKQRNG
ncbi:MAG: ribosome small subunit-dependent GTPase A [Candidatus Nomurabacteria bacterium]|jgi:ribosome biogenesis GTPase|nr:ribosome small subunit-dependent GTPase A [Candidatus Nomurabacteria bacterium]